MSVPAAILGTTSTHGGEMISANGTLFSAPGTEGVLCILGDLHSCPIPGHGITPIISGCATASMTNGNAIAIEGSVARCGAVLNGNFATDIMLT